MGHLVRRWTSSYRGDTTYTVGLVALQSTQLPQAVSVSALAQSQWFNCRTLLEVVPPCMSSTSRKSAFSELIKNRIPGKQMSCTWKNFALYLISSVCNEQTAGFNRFQPSLHIANTGHKPWNTHSRSPTGDIADKNRLDIPLWPDTSVVAHGSDACSPTAGQGMLLLLMRVTDCSIISLKAMPVSVT